MDKIKKILVDITDFKNGDVKYGYNLALHDIKKFINSFSEEPISEDFKEALAQEWKGYNDRGAATVDALEDNTQELAFAKGFYRGARWQKEQDAKKIETAIDFAFHGGRCQKEEEMLKNAIDATIGLPYENKDGGYTHLVDVSRHLPVGDNKIAIIFKED